MARGRTRGFDYDKALDAAVLVFWRDGYSCASLSTLCDSMSLNKPSLYSAFGDKQQLFKLALARYEATYTAPLLSNFLANEDVLAGVRNLWHDIVDMTTVPQRPRGCLVVCSTIDNAAASTTPEIQDAVNIITLRWTDSIHRRIREAQKAAPEIAGRDALLLAQYVMMVFAGLTVGARSGVDRKTLHAVAVEAAQGLSAREGLNNATGHDAAR